MTKKKGKRTSKSGSGLRNSRRAKRIISRLMLKLNRWERYREEISKGRREGPELRWNPEGIEKYINLLEKVT